jgi:hypothetical protein
VKPDCDAIQTGDRACTPLRLEARFGLLSRAYRVVSTIVRGVVSVGSVECATLRPEIGAGTPDWSRNSAPIQLASSDIERPITHILPAMGGVNGRRHE